MYSHFTQCIKWKLEADEYVLNPNRSVTDIYRNLTISEDEYRKNNRNELYVCVPKDAQPPFYYMDLVYASEFMLSAVFLLVSVTLHYVRSQSNANRPLVYHQICLIAFYLTGFTYVVSQYDNLTWFYVAKYVGSYSIRAAFCWLTVINYDKWKQLRPENMFTIFTSTTKFFLQSLFAWSVPALIIGITSCLQFFGVSDNSGYAILHQSRAEIIFLYTTTIAILITNVVFFLMTIRNLRRYTNAVVDANSKIYCQLWVVYLKLMTVTGLNWIFFVLEWSFNDLAPSYIWMIVDVFNSLQGFLIFLVYHCKILTLRKFGGKLCRLIDCAE